MFFRAILLFLFICLFNNLSLSGREISVVGLGAVPDDAQDDTAVIQAALDGLKGTSDVTLVFPAGRYLLQDSRPAQTLRIQEINNLTIIGTGAELVFGMFKAGLAIGNCAGVTIRGLTFDWSPLPFSVGTVSAISDSRTFDVTVEDPAALTEGIAVEAFMEYDPATRHPQSRGLDVYGAVESTELPAAGVVRLHLKRDVPVKPGMLMVLRHKVYSSNAIAFSDCRDVLVEDVTIYTAPGMGIVGQGTENITIRRLQVIPRPGTQRIMSTTADATHFNGCYGSITVEDSVFEGMGDDAVNIHGMYHIVDAVADAHTVITRCRNDWLKPPRKGDVMEFTDPATLLPLASDTVAGVVIDKEAKRHRITFTNPVPAGVVPDYGLGNTAWAPRTLIRGNTVRWHRARGMLIQTRDAMIEGNRFEGSSGAALHITCDLDYWTESIATHDITIHGNTFEGCNYGAAMMPGCIMVFAHIKGGRFSPAGVHRGLTINANTFRDTDNSAMCITSARGVTVINNRIVNAGRNPSQTSGRSAIYLEYASDVTISGNTITPGANAGPEITYGPSGAPAGLALPPEWLLNEGEGIFLDGGMEVTSDRNFLLLLPGTTDRITYSARFPADTVLGVRACELSAVIACDPAKPYKSGYMFQFGGKGNTSTQLLRNGRTVMDVTSPATLVAPGRAYKVVLRAADGVITVMLDGKEIIRYTDPEPLSGGRAAVYSWGRGAQFTDIQIAPQK